MRRLALITVTRSLNISTISASPEMYTIYLSLVVTKSLGQPLRSRAIASHDLVSYWCAHHKYGINLHGTLVQISSEIREDHSAYNVCIPCFYGHHSTRSNILSNHSICVIETKTIHLTHENNGASFPLVTTLYLNHHWFQSTNLVPMLIQMSYDCRATTWLLLIWYKTSHDCSWLNRQTSVHAFCNRETVRDNPAGQCFLDRLVNGSICMLSSVRLRICIKVYMYLQNAMCV